MARVLQVCNNDFYLTHFLAPLIRRLRGEGHDVECVCDGNLIDRDLLGGTLPVYQLAFPLSNSIADFARAIRELRQVIRRGRYDCVNSHNRSASIVARLAAWLESVPVSLYTAHGYYFHDDQRWFAREASIGLEAILAKITDYTLSQSDEDVALMLGRGFVEPGTIEVIGNGIDTARFAPRPASQRRGLELQLGLRTGRFRVVSTGRLVRAKGFTDVLVAFAELRKQYAEAEFVIVGGNVARDLEPYQEQFFRLARAHGLESDVVVTGIVRCVEDYLAVADAFVLASYREGLPRAMLEAMSMRLPVVVTDIRGCRQVVEHGSDGLVFPAHDTSKLAGHLLALRRDSELRKRLGEAAREKVCARFDERDYVERQVHSINRLVGTPGKNGVELQAASP